MRIIKQLLSGIAICLLASLATGHYAAQGVQVFDTDRQQAAEGAVRAELKDRAIAGATVGVTRNGRLVFVKGFGSANVEKSFAAAPNTRYQIGSTTKPFTAIAILMLVEDGKIVLDEKAARYVSGLPAQYSAISVRQLLSHTSGIARDLRTGNTDDFTIEEFWKRLAAAPPSFAPGTRWEYSNTGYILLGLLIEAVAKKSYGEFLNERIFRPLGMADTSYLEPVGGGRDRAVGYDWTENGFRPSPYFSGGFGAGGLVSTVPDLARWDAALNTEKLLKRNSLEQMWKPAQLADGRNVSFDFRGRPTSYGLGWFLSNHAGRSTVFHGGTVSGFSSQIIRFTDDRITIIVTSNSKSGADRFGYAEVLAERLAAIYAHRDLTKEQ